MQITTGWTCRECGRDNTITTDTSEAGVGALKPVVSGTVYEGRIGSLHNLFCPRCQHISGEIGFHYRFDADKHAPQHEKEEV